MLCTTNNVIFFSHQKYKYCINKTHEVAEKKNMMGGLHTAYTVSNLRGADLK